ncbi:Aminotran-5 domain-containing protein [Mycena indigotica]|uniref:Aminotran-5 domain-containing protein n=1 Tax=Mycena indigotica TaxID=2126181 RepID=A0A8H6SCU9_9AGAR|nr:Aminotran-5 domain-containing protein [Mycena indigotica]KAF7297201.1 Aminotran-5 domain-containing protein [Mycena indigotica]
MTQLDYSLPPPPFGHEMLKYFAFDPNYVNLNHGSYGSLPLPVLAACNELTMRVESNPDLFVRIHQTALITECRELIAKFLHTKTNEVVLVRNTSHGINTIMRSFDWNAGDVIVTCNTTYDAMSALARFLGDGPAHPAISQLVIQWPTSHADIIARYQAHLRAIPRHSGQKIVAIIDSVTSVPGALMPWQALVKLCKDEGVYSVIDGAHSIGQEPDINLGDADPDFWVSNCHKWLFAKRGCAVMFVAERNQGIVRSSFPTSKVYISPPARSYPGESFVEQYNWNGTIDFVPPLSIKPALEFRQWLGGEAKISKYCRDMALQGGAHLAALLGTRVMDQSGEFTLNMANVQIPLPPTIQPSAAIGDAFNQKMLLPTSRKTRVSAGVYYHNAAWWVRCSAQIWTQLEDFEVLASVLKEVCLEITHEFQA